MRDTAASVVSALSGCVNATPLNAASMNWSFSLSEPPVKEKFREEMYLFRTKPHEMVKRKEKRPLRQFAKAGVRIHELCLPLKYRNTTEIHTDVDASAPDRFPF